jgi:hypothetical protein
MMRLGFFILICVVIMLVIAVIVLAFNTGAVMSNGVMIPADTSIIRELIWLVGTILMFAFGGKAVQKYGEREVNIEQRLPAAMVEDIKNRIGFSERVRERKGGRTNFIIRSEEK